MIGTALFIHRTECIGGLRMHLVEQGRGRPVVLLHGFPEFWYSWRHQIPCLAKYGYRAVAPDLRGYNESDHPTDVASYRTSELVRDVAGLIERLGEPAYVVGHDWGGVLAWRLAAIHPQLVRRLAILNAPHPGAYRQELLTNPAQVVRSSYALYFQLRGWAERTLRAGDYGLIERAFRYQAAHARTFSDSDIRAYKAAISRAGLTGPLNYYRAAVRYPNDLFGEPQTIQVPTLLIWGERDPYLCPSLADRLQPWVPNLSVHRIPYVGHWVQNDAPQRVNRVLKEFFEAEDALSGRVA